ncbi:PCMD domain-containing protein [Chryseobacterium sp. C-71]|uniref:PCMD domain-containing protein n=1 Tax=Chryseobacterium sp. C-71 TaxID=2893882 RepID=UPI001E583E51|nr:PCMD domain-containing protein [Chryseobacterium sp. C-71]UFH33915.1 PCMD domain-containing protein [Chryseobacterium sp. C-71]
MKNLFYLILMYFTLGSCIREAPLNPEADIEEFNIDAQFLSSSTIIDQANSKILIYLKPDAYQSGVSPALKLSKGATVSPASGTLVNFSQPVFYTVKSESGENLKTYEVDVVEIGNWTFNFETWTENAQNKYEYPLDNNVQLWSSGNPGAALAGVMQQTDAYPTKSTINGLNGTKAAEMRTIPGTTLSEFLGIKLIPGSFFLGDFNSNQALINPLAATEFGQPYFQLPEKFTGYYTYTPGGNFQDQNGNTVPGQTDRFSLYAVLYNGPTRLNGTNINTSDQVIARAKLPNTTAPTAFTRFEVPFNYIPGKTPGNNLMVAIVASSSYQGDQYRGAIGSKLTVDSLRIIAK